MNSNRLTDLVYFRDAGLKSFYKFVIPLISSKWLCFHCLVPITRSMAALDIVPKINGYKNLKNGHSTLGCVGQSGLQRKKNPSCHKYATFEVSFLCFHGLKQSLVLLLKLASCDNNKLQPGHFVSQYNFLLLSGHSMKSPINIVFLPSTYVQLSCLSLLEYYDSFKITYVSK